MSNNADSPRKPIFQKLKTLVIGGARSPLDHSVFHQLSLIAFFAWVGLGADGLSSSCYGPPEAFLALGKHAHLILFVGLGTAVTVFIISASYSQIIELFPSGGGGYVVASKLLSPTVGMISGCALIIDYVLTISVSIASGADAVFSFLPAGWAAHKLTLAVAGVGVLTILNLRGVKESVIPLVPVFLIFVLTHAFAILYAVLAHATALPDIARATALDAHSAASELGTLGAVILLVRAYSMGAGTFTGIEAVSNGLAILREPRVRTGRRTMRYMAVSLAVTSLGLMIAYLLLAVHAEGNKTLNAVLFEHVAAAWPGALAVPFVLVTLLSEAAILFVAAQAGFLDGPRVISNMALDRWLPSRFATLSDRLVTRNGILLMGASALAIMLFSRGSVNFLIVLYSINVFITFCLSQLGMVRHWWSQRRVAGAWLRRLLVNGVGLVTCALILISIILVKFNQGGWLTLVITGALVGTAVLVRRHYKHSAKLLARLQELVKGAETIMARQRAAAPAEPKEDTKSKTAVILVSGFNGLGLHSFFSVQRLFGAAFKNVAFASIGLVDAGNFKGSDKVAELGQFVKGEIDKYVSFARMSGYYAEGFYAVGVDIVDEMAAITPTILKRFPNAVFFGGQMIFPEETFLTRWLHNFVVFAVQRRLYREGVPFVILPVRV